MRKLHPGPAANAAAIFTLAILSASAAFAATPIAHWNFDYAPIGAEKNDYPDMISQRNLTIENKAAVVPYDGTDAPFGKALSLTGQTGGYLSAPPTLGPWYGKSFTVAMWVKTAGDGKTDYIISDWGKDYKNSFTLGLDYKKPNTDEHMIADLRSPVIKENTKKTAKYHPSVVKAESSKTVTQNIWHHLAWVWDKTDAQHGTMTMYLDGEEVGNQKNATGNSMTSVEVLNNNHGFKIGLKEDNGLLFTGAIDEVWIYGDALTKDQVDNLMKTNDIEKSSLPIAVAPTPTPAPTQVAVVTPTPTVTPTPAPTPTPEVVTPTPTPTVTPTPAPTPVVVVTPTPVPTPTPVVVAPVEPTPVAPLTIARPVTAVPLAAVTAKGYSPERLAGIVSTALLACGLSGFLLWAKGERSKMRGSRR